MSNDTVIPQEIYRYIQRLLIGYKTQNAPLFSILRELKKSNIEVVTETRPEEDIEGISGNAYIKDYYYHKLVLWLSKECFENHIPLEKQKELAKKLENDLNRIISVPYESISEVVFELKDKIDIDDHLKDQIKVDPKNITFWEPDCLRVFISHSVKDYEIANILKDQFINFGISCFVAHKDIEPTTQWIEEIKKALNLMEVMLLLVTGDSCESWWVNQEIGFALSRSIPIIPIKLDQNDPKGFINAVQAMSIEKNEWIKATQSQNAVLKELYDFIRNKFPEHSSWKKNLLSKFLKAKDGTFASAKRAFMDIINFQFDDQEIEKIVETIEGPAKTSMNQLTILLMPEHLNESLSKEYEYYAELLGDKILSQHTKKRYSIRKLLVSEPERRGHLFKIIDSHQNMNNQKPDTNNNEDIPF